MSNKTRDIIFCVDCKYIERETVEEFTPYGNDYTTYFGCSKMRERTGEWYDVMLDDCCDEGERKIENKL